MEGKLNFLFAIIAVVLIAWIALWTYSCSGPSTPPYFNKRLALEDAITQADQSNKPVFALFTADWCEPCQKLKRRALSDSKVIAWIEGNAQPAYVDLSKADAGDGLAAETASRYSIQAFPTLMLLRKGHEIARLEGVVSASELLKWLADNSAATPKG